MTEKTIISLIILSILFFIIIIKFLKKNLLTPTSIILWICLGLFIISISILNSFYRFIAKNIFGLYDTTNLIYIIIVGFLCIYSLYLTVKLKKLIDMIQMLITKNSILELEIKKVKDQKK